MAAGGQVILRRREFCHHQNDYSGVDVQPGHKDIGNPKNGYRNSSNGWNSVSKQDCRDGSKDEREPGELSSERGVENGCTSQSQVTDDDDDVEVQFPPEKRRKFSPIVWDRDGKEVKISSKNRVVYPANLTFSRQSQASFHDEEAGLGPKCRDSVKRCFGSVIADPAANGFCGHVQAGSLSSDHDQGGMEGDFVQTRNLMMSRWASDSDSPRSECDDGEMRAKKISSCESGEFRAEGFSLSRDRSSNSARVSPCGGPSSECDRTPHELLSHESVEIDDNLSEVDVADSDDKGRSPLGHRNINMLQSCRSVFEFEKLNKINEGTYGVVYKARDKKTGDIVALKKVKMNVDNRDGFPMSSLREINILLSLNHPSIVDVKEVVMDGLDSVFLVMEYMEHDLKGLMEMMKQPFGIGEVKFLMLQLLQGVKYLHDNWVLHRDLKTSNLLLNKEGELKICDFGLSRQYGSPLMPYTPLVVTLWYRAPELLLNTKQYSTAIDMWSVGCILAEVVSKEPLFTGKTEIDQLNKIYHMLGTPDEKSWPELSKLPGLKGNFVKQCHNSLRKKFPATSFTGAPTLSELGLDLLNKLLTYDPEKRITAEAALNHGWFREAPLPKHDFQPVRRG